MDNTMQYNSFSYFFIKCYCQITKKRSSTYLYLSKVTFFRLQVANSNDRVLIQ